MTGRRVVVASAVAATAVAAAALAFATWNLTERSASGSVATSGSALAAAHPPSPGTGASGVQVPADRAYVAPAQASQAQVVPGGLIPAKGPKQPTVAPVPARTLPSGVPRNVSPGAAPPALTLEVATTPAYGLVLVTPSGMTLYRQSHACSCDGQYRALLAVPGQQLRLPPLLPGQLGTVPLANGAAQVTFDGWPVFLYDGDRVPADANGVNLDWQVIQPLTQ